MVKKVVNFGVDFYVGINNPQIRMDCEEVVKDLVDEFIDNCIKIVGEDNVDWYEDNPTSIDVTIEGDDMEEYQFIYDNIDDLYGELCYKVEMTTEKYGDMELEELEDEDEWWS